MGLESYDQKRLKIFEEDKNFKFVNGDIKDQNLLLQSLEDVFGVIILAGLVGDPITKKYPELSNDINYVGIKKAIDLSILKNVRRIIFVSTCSNYGLIKDDQTADEDFVLNPLSLYAKSKVDIEKYEIKCWVNKYIEANNLPTVIRLGKRNKSLRFNQIFLSLMSSNKMIITYINHLLIRVISNDLI